MRKIKLLITATVLSILTSCVNGDDYGVPDLSGECVDLVSTKTIPDLLLTANSSPQLDNSHDIIEAIVTSSDEGGNFYKSISLMTVDGTKGFTMPIDSYNLYTNFEPGRKVYVIMDSLYYDYNSQISSLEIGSLYNNDTPDNLTDDRVGRISSVKYKNVLKRSCTKIDEDEIVKRLEIAEALDNKYLNMLVEFDNIQFTNISLGHTYFDRSLNPVSTWTATNHKITDNLGQEVIVRVSEFANFSSLQIPEGSGKIRGILTKYNNDYQLMIRTINDVELNNERFELLIPFFIEDFQSATNNTNVNNSGWTNYAEAGSWLWREKTFQGNGYAEFSAYNSGAVSNKVWLISPNINLNNTDNEVLSFKIAKHHLDVDSPNNSLQVFISTNYDGTNVLAADWELLNANIPTTSISDYQFLTSFINISNYSGNVHIAFKFTGSGTDTTLDGAFQVDDLKVYGE